MRILIADHLSKVRYALSVLIQKQQGWSIAGDALNAAELLAKASELQPEVMMVDWDLPGLPIQSLIPALRRIRPGCVIILLSVRPEQRQQALSLGANFFLSKVDSPDRILEILHECEVHASL